jgi:hypothetical protein
MTSGFITDPPMTVAVDRGHGRLALLAKDARGAQLSRSQQAAAGGSKRGEKRTAAPTKLQIHA